MQEVNSAAEIIDALGGNGAVSKLFGVVPHAVSQWRTRNRLPTNTKDVLISELKQRGLTAPSELWRMRNVSEPRI